MAQIKQHRWMLADPAAARQILTHSLTEYNSNLGDYSEPVLSIMNTLGIDRQKTIEVPKHFVLTFGETRFSKTEKKTLSGTECRSDGIVNKANS